MLSKQRNGWTCFKLKKNIYKLSYLTDLPIDWLDQTINGLETMQPFVVHAELEPGRILCLVSYYNCYVFVEELENNKNHSNDEMNCEVVNISMVDFCKMLYDDISSDIDGWCNWSYKGSCNKSIFVRKLERLKKLLTMREE